MFFKKIHNRLKIVYLLLLILFIIIIIKVLYIQVFSYNKLNNYANNLWSRNLPIEANRGKIYDRNGVILADNITTTSLVLIPNQIVDKQQAARLIAPILNVSYEQLYAHTSKKTSIERVHPEGRRLSYEVANKINALNLSGVYLLKEAKRYYPNDTMLAHTLGFVGIDNQGLSGLELMYNNYLTGSFGAIKYFSDAKGNKLKLAEKYEKPQDGININLTIDYNIQVALERELDNTLAKYNPDQALGLVMNPKTGEILAISSRPNFKPSDYTNYTTEIINRNLPIWATYEPGSTFKIITLAASLEEKIIDLDKDTYFDTGSVKVSGATLHCWKHGGHGQQTYLNVVENSCNTGFVNLGLKLGKDKLFSYIDKFGFGSKTGVDLNGESNGIIFNKDKIGDLELATTAFGQGVSVTPIQQITAVSAAINGGVLYKPYIVKSLNEPVTNSVVVKNDPKIVRKVLSDEASSKVRYALESVVANGTGRPAYISQYRVGGKTGTAQKVKDGKYLVGNYIVSFIGFLPADDPEVIVYIAIDNAKGVTQYGGTVAAPIARNIMLGAIDALKINKKEGLNKKYKYGDQIYYEVFDTTNLDVKEAVKKLKNFKIEFSGTGNIIKYQTPKTGFLYEGDTIKLLLGDE
ncbi:MAG: stage V sporulation protein D [Bacilli bacterium]